MRRNNKLQNKVHWRRIKNILNALINIEGIKCDYDFNNICCYSCIGEDLQGKNINFKTYQGESCWVDDNKYNIFEVSKKTNRKDLNGYGDFLFLAYNINFRYWVFGKFKIILNYRKTINKTSTYESCVCTPYGYYTIGDEYNLKTLKKTVRGSQAIYRWKK